MPSPTSTLLPGVKDEPESAELASEAASKPTAAALLSLPTELLDRIARNVAPLGGKKAVNLRLVSRQLAVVASPVVLSSLLLPAHREQTDEILTVVLRDLNLTLVVTSVRYDVPDVEVTLVYAVLEAMKNLRRLSVVGNSYAAGAQLSNPFFTSLGRMKQLETLELRKIDLAGHRDLTSWIGARRLVVSYCPNSHIIFTDTRGNTKVSELQSLSYEDISVGTVDALNTLWSCSASASDVTIGWRVVTDSTLLPTFIDGVSWKPLTARRPLTLTLEGLLSLFDVSRGDHAFSTSVVVRVLNWITPLKVLSFPVHQTFSVADGFASLNLPALESLSLVRATWSSFGLQPDLLTMATYKHLVRLLSTSTLPALTTLHLRGWIDTTTVSTLASSSHHDLTREHPLIFSLLGFLRNTPIQELRLANSDGHPEDDVDVSPRPRSTIDLSRFDSDKAALAQDLISAVRTKGFFYVKGWAGITQERVDRQFAIGQQFYELPLEEKAKFIPNLEAGEYNGTDLISGLTDRTEVFNIPKFNEFFEEHHKHHPAPVAENLDEIKEFARDLHNYIFDPLLVLIAIALELPEDYLTNIHQYEKLSEDHHRFMKYSKHTPEETEILIQNNGGLWGADLGTLTLLFRQPVAALQIQDRSTKEWRWVKPQDGTLTVNACDALSFLTGNYIKSTIHRVAVPPEDQRHVDRLGLLYFARPQKEVLLEVIKESPVLQRAGITANEFERIGQVPTMKEWTVRKQTWQQSKGGHKANAVILPGFQEQVYA